MLQLSDTNHNKICILNSYKDYYVEQIINVDDLLCFSYPVNGSQYSLIAFECYIRDGNNEYVVKEINVQGSETGMEWAQFICKVNLENLKGKTVTNFTTITQKAEDAVNLALAGTGWIVGTCDVTRLRSVAKAQCSVYDVLTEIVIAYACEITYDAINKYVNIHEKQGSDRGTYFAEQLNLKQLQSQSNTNEYITRLVPIGVNGLNITSVNSGINFVSNYQYSNKVITGYWIDNRYTLAKDLKDDAIERLAYLSKPNRAYSASIIDLASVSDTWGLLDFALGDFITLLSESKNVRELQRIIKIDRYPEEPERSSIEIANRIAKLEDIILRVVATSNLVDGMSDTTGSVVASSVSGTLTNAYIPVANVGDLTVTLAAIGTLVATKASITSLDVINASIENLTANQISTIDFNAQTACIVTLETNSATVTQLNATNASITNLSVASAHLTNGIIDNATIDVGKINNLSSTYATITNLASTNGNITNLTSSVASIDTLLAGNIGAANLAAGAIQAGSAIIADGAIGSAQILSLDVIKLNTGTLDTSKITVAGPDGRLKITGNRLQVFAGTSTLYERVSVGDVNGDGTNYGIRVRGADGNTVIFDENGVRREGITDGSINNAKIGTDASISGTKLDIVSVVTSINGGTTTIQGSKILLNSSTLDVQFSALNTTVTAQGVTLSSNTSSITALNNSIVLKVATTDYSTYQNSVASSFTTSNENVTIAQTQANLGVTNAAIAQTAANSKKRVFTVTPTTQYDIGDLWSQGVTGDMMTCTTTRSSGGYVAGDWVKSAKYTDDTVAIGVQTNLNNTNTNVTSVTTRMTVAEASITTQAGQIVLKASQTSLDTTNTNVTTAQTQATLGVTNAGTAQTAANLANTNATALTTRVTTAETSIVTNAGNIALRATNASLATTNTNVATAQTQATLGVTNAAIAQGAANTANGTANTLRDITVPTLTTRVSTAETKITPAAITSTVTTSAQYVSDLGAKITSAQGSVIAQTAANIKIGFNGISAGVVIDSTGILVNQGNYRVIEDNGTQIIVGSKENLLHDSSFENLDFVGAFDYTYQDLQAISCYYWGVVASPRLVSTPFGTIFGSSTVAVTSDNYVYGETDSFSVLPNKIYTISAFVTPHFYRNTVGSSINYNIKVDVYNKSGGIALTQNFNGNITTSFAAPSSDYVNNNPIKRVFGTITAPAASSYIKITLTSASTTQWVIFDGIQIVNASYPIAYIQEHEDSLSNYILDTGTVVGQVTMFAGPDTPAGNWLRCDGSAIGRVAYAALFAHIGTNYGAGDGSTTFNVPDMRGIFPRGWSDSSAADSGRAIGSLQAGSYASHQHSVHSEAWVNSSGSYKINVTTGGAVWQNTQSLGGRGVVYGGNAGGTETRPINKAFLMCIKY